MVKRFLCIVMISLMTFLVIGCSSEDIDEVDEGPRDTTLPDASQTDNTGDILVAYFSWADNAIASASDVDLTSTPSVSSSGNVEELAQWVSEATGGDLFSIRVRDPYPNDWDGCLDRANTERAEDARPELIATDLDISSYDTIFLGYPNWWYGVPMALLSFLEANDLSNKDVYLFCSHGTGGLANSVEIISEAIPDANISEDIFDCYEEEASSSKEDIEAWIDDLGLTRDVQDAISDRQIAVRFGDYEVIYELNDSSAAFDLLAMLPLSIEVEDYSTNEKIFYPEMTLDVSDTPLAASGVGTLAYYEPWGDVVFFYGKYDENASLYELGQAVSGAEYINMMQGTIEISIIE